MCSELTAVFEPCKGSQGRSLQLSRNPQSYACKTKKNTQTAESFHKYSYLKTVLSILQVKKAQVVILFDCVAFSTQRIKNIPRLNPLQTLFQVLASFFSSNTLETLCPSFVFFVSSNCCSVLLCVFFLPFPHFIPNLFFYIF